MEVFIASELRVEGILGCGRRSGDGNCEIMKPQTLNIIYPWEASHVPWESNEISAMNYYYYQSYIYIYTINVSLYDMYIFGFLQGQMILSIIEHQLSMGVKVRCSITILNYQMVVPQSWIF